MPAPVSKKQFRMMQAIIHEGNKKKPARGDHGPNPSVARQYVNSHVKEKDLPESKGKELEGGNWDEHRTKKKHQKRADKKTRKEKAAEKQKHKKEHAEKSEHIEDLDKAMSMAAAMLIMDNNNRILLGHHAKGKLAFPGGTCDTNDLNSEFTAIRETKEETGLNVDSTHKIWSGNVDGDRCDVFLANTYTGKLAPSSEMKNFKWYDAHSIPWSDVRHCCVEPLKYFVENKLGKSQEFLEKNIIRDKSTAVYEVTHGDALRLVGTGLFRKLKSSVDGMQDEDFKDVEFDTYKVKIRKHTNDVYSGNVLDGHKVIYQFTNKSLPELTAALMSIFEWYLPEDQEIIDLVSDDKITDDSIKDGLKSLVDNYKKHNIGNIYEEMENIRQQIRNDAAVDIQQVESRIMKLFDKLEDVVHTVIGKHNTLKDLSEKELEDIQQKLREMQQKIEDMSKKPETLQAVSSVKKDPDKIHREEYPYLPRPLVEISPEGKIRITFASEWTTLEKENFLNDMKAKIIKKEK